jgi:hypothetical protein
MELLRKNPLAECRVLVNEFKIGSWPLLRLKTVHAIDRSLPTPIERLTDVKNG